MSLFEENLTNKETIQEGPQIEEVALEDFEFVRQEYFSNIKEPSITFARCSFYVNVPCLTHFPESDYVQILINKKTKMLVLRPSSEEDRDSFLWCSTLRGKKKPRRLSCKLFFAKIVDLMGWNQNHRYRILGKIAHANGESILVFDLKVFSAFKSITSETSGIKSKSVPMFPEDWKTQFGLPYSEHQTTSQISLFDGFAVYSLTDNDEKEDHK